MKVLMSNWINHEGKDLKPGKTVDIDEGTAKNWVRDGYAQLVDDHKKSTAKSD